MICFLPIRSVNNVSVLDFIADCFKIAYLYFGTIQTKIGPVVCSIIVPDRSPARKAIKSQNADGSSNNDDEDPEDIDDDDASSLDATSANNPGAPAGNVQDLFAKLAIDSKSVLSSSSLTTAAPGNQTMPETAMTLEMLEESFKDDEDSEDEGDDGTAKTFEAFIQKHGRELTPKQARKVTELVPKNMIQFKFDGDILTMGQVLKSSRSSYTYLFLYRFSIFFSWLSLSPPRSSAQYAPWKVTCKPTVLTRPSRLRVRSIRLTRPIRNS